ncbi:MAG: FAD-dependent oxidoreductase [Lachnospiraceae bacterium]|jgi:NADPH-dependent 2,4-dienoyl-CoA reductase/sulfur reductase-like enzyme|nr:FAD-dependent oxidoreductase [Lachnospiraceae bacterium]
MKRKILIVGGVAGGATAAARIRRLDEEAEILIFEKSEHVSYSNCSLPFYLGGVVEDEKDLVMVEPETFAKRYNMEARTQSEVLAVNRKEKTVTVLDHAAGREYEESYDKLILAPGARPLRPGSISGIEKDHVFAIRNVRDVVLLKAYLEEKDLKHVVVIGGGFIGIETAENLVRAGYHVAVSEAMEQILSVFDEDMVQILHKELYDNGVELHLGEKVQEITEKYVIMGSGKEIRADAVVLAMGVQPEIGLAREAGLSIGETGGIRVDRNCRTSDSDIYAVGDAIEVTHKLTRRSVRLTLAGPAQRQARIAANHIYGIPDNGGGVIGSSVLRVFRLNAACTGLNEGALKKAGISYGFSYVIPNDRVSIMPDCSPLHFKLLYERPTGKLLGAQAIGQGEADKRIDVIAAMISRDAGLEELKELELCYSPLYGTARDVVNQAALVGLNLLSGAYRQVSVSEVRHLVEKGAYIIDVREKGEFERGHLKNAVNLPLSELRERLSEIPKDRPVYLHCQSGQRSYQAVRALQNLGFGNVCNISGSFLGICLYEFYHDSLGNREKIVTEYHFR